MREGDLLIVLGSAMSLRLDSVVARLIRRQAEQHTASIKCPEDGPTDVMVLRVGNRWNDVSIEIPHDVHKPPGIGSPYPHDEGMCFDDCHFCTTMRKQRRRVARSNTRPRKTILPMSGRWLRARDTLPARLARRI